MKAHSMRHQGYPQIDAPACHERVTGGTHRLVRTIRMVPRREGSSTKIRSAATAATVGSVALALAACGHATRVPFASPETTPDRAVVLEESAHRTSAGWTSVPASSPTPAVLPVPAAETGPPTPVATVGTGPTKPTAKPPTSIVQVTPRPAAPAPTAPAATAGTGTVKPTAKAPAPIVQATPRPVSPAPAAPAAPASKPANPAPVAAAPSAPSRSTTYRGVPVIYADPDGYPGAWGTSTAQAMWVYPAAPAQYVESVKMHEYMHVLEFRAGWTDVASTHGERVADAGEQLQGGSYFKYTKGSPTATELAEARALLGG